MKIPKCPLGRPKKDYKRKVRRSWTRNPKTQVVPNKKKSKAPKWIDEFFED